MIGYIYIYIYIEGIWQTLLYKVTVTKCKFVEGDSNISLWYIKIRIEQVFTIARLIKRFS